MCDLELPSQSSSERLDFCGVRQWLAEVRVKRIYYLKHNYAAGLLRQPSQSQVDFSLGLLVIAPGWKLGHIIHSHTYVVLCRAHTGVKCQRCLKEAWRYEECSLPTLVSSSIATGSHWEFNLNVK